MVSEMNKMNETNTLKDDEMKSLLDESRKSTNGKSVKSTYSFSLPSKHAMMKLLQKSSIVEGRDEIEERIVNGETDIELYYMLLQHQLDPIEQGEGYSQTDILKKLIELDGRIV